MAMKTILDKLEDVSEVFRDQYIEKDGKFHLDLEGLDGHPVVKGLRDENAKRRIKERDLDGQLNQFRTAFGDKKLEDIMAQLDRIPELEELSKGKADEATIAKLVEGRLATATGPLKRDLDRLKAESVQLTGVIEEYKARDRQRAIGDKVREALAKSQGFQPSAFEDAILLAERVFEVGEDGTVTTKDGAGITPGLAPDVWLTEMQKTRPHWWGASQGGGALGNRSGGAGGVNPWTAENWNMTEQGKILRENRQRAEQLARAAGTVLGGAKPPLKK